MEQFVEMVILFLMTCYVTFYAGLVWQQKKDDDKVQDYLKKMEEKEE